MSKIAKKPLQIPEGTEVVQKDGVLQFKGKRGSHAVKVLPYLTVEVKEGAVQVNREANHKQARSNAGTMASLIVGALKGVSEGFAKDLEIEGVGYRVAMQGKDLTLNVGFSHPVVFKAPEGITLSVEKNKIKVEGIDKALVGQVAAEIRAIKKPEPYKGKGIHYVGEVIRRKAGKKVAGTGASAGGAA